MELTGGTVLALKKQAETEEKTLLPSLASNKQREKPLRKNRRMSGRLRARSAGPA